MMIKMSVDKLIKKLTDKKAEVREKSVIELGKLGDSKAVEPLITRLKDDDENVRLWAAVSLGKIGDERAIEPLMRLVKTDSQKVKREAAGAIAKIMPEFDDINIDEITRKIEDAYQEEVNKKTEEQQLVTEQMDFELEKEQQIKKQIQEKYFEKLQQSHFEELTEEPNNIKDIEPKAEKNLELEKEEKAEEPEIGIEEFMSALKKAPIADRVEELSNILTKAMNLFVDAIDDISARLTNIENNIEQRFQEIDKKVEGVPAIFPSKGQVASEQLPLQSPKPISQLSTRSALNEELKKVLHGRKVEE